MGGAGEEMLPSTDAQITQVYAQLSDGGQVREAGRKGETGHL